jgi:hypothetical protein
MFPVSLLQLGFFLPLKRALLLLLLSNHRFFVKRETYSRKNT